MLGSSVVRQASLYYLRKRADGKTSRETLRCLKRRLSDLVYRSMLNDALTSHNTTVMSPVVSAVGSREPDRRRSRAVGAADANEARLTA